MWNKSKMVLRILFRSCLDLFRLSPFFVSWSIGCVLVLAAIPVVQIYVTSRLINAIADVFRQGATSLSTVYIYIAISSAILFLNQIVGEVNKTIHAAFQQTLHHATNIRVFQKTRTTPLELLEQADHLNAQSRAFGNGSRSLALFITTISFVQHGISACGILAVLFHMHWMLAVVLLMVAVPSLFTNLAMSQKHYNLAYKQTPRQRLLGYLSTLLSTRDTAKEFRIFSHDTHIQNKWSTLYWENSSEQLRLVKLSATVSIALQFLNFVTSAAALVIVVHTGITHQFTIGEYAAISAAILSATAMLNSATGSAARIYEDAVKVNDYYHYLDDPVRLERTEAFAPPPPVVEEGITVTNVSFTYPNRTKPALQHISFHIKKGEKVAIVGENGAGKSTLAKCLLGLYTYQEGSIYFGQTEMRSEHKHEINVSAVFQDFTKYHLSIRENIGFGHLAHMDNDALLDVAAKQTGIHDYVLNAPQQYDTGLGTLYGKGQELSGGLWQRIALSRGFFKPHDYIVLDEPTSALDPLNEAEVVQNMIDMSRNKTAIFITHRMGSCKLVDRILVIKHGQLVEEGSHEQLMQNKNGEYYRMYTAQSHLYADAAPETAAAGRPG